MDKSVQVLDKLTTFIETLNKAMPGAWEAAVKQSYIYGVVMILCSFFCGAIIAFLVNNLKNKTKKDEGYEGGGEMLIGLCALIVGVSLLIMGIMHLINVDYYAIQLLKP